MDFVVTSPPYLNAIDYVRGHRLALVWLGWNLGELRQIRGRGVGAERAPDAATGPRSADERRAQRFALERALPPRQQRMVERYVLDVQLLTNQVARILKRNGEVVWVIGNSALCGESIDNAGILRRACARAGLTTIHRKRRLLPGAARYLPPPNGKARRSASDLSNRMLEEVVLTMVKGRR